jgi:DNA-binding protein H-NS
LEARVAVLEANVATLRTEQEDTYTQLREEMTKRLEAINVERQAQESVTNELRTQLDSFGAGSLHLETAGMFWLVLGVVLATASTEVAAALKWFT